MRLLATVEIDNKGTKSKVVMMLQVGSIVDKKEIKNRYCIGSRAASTWKLTDSTVVNPKKFINTIKTI